MTALVLEEKGKLSLRDIALPEALGPRDLRIAVHTVGICGSDVHYYTEGKIGPFVVEAPLVLGHEAAGTVTEVGAEVTALEPGDRVCMEPGIPDTSSRAALMGMYNVDPAVTFWATPPVHGCLTPSVVHPAAFTFKLPEGVSMAEGAMVEPFAIGMQAATRAGIKPGDTAVVIGAGPIGMMVALAALAGGCARVIVADLSQAKLDIIGAYPGIIAVPAQALAETVERLTSGWGVDCLFEASGAAPVFPRLTETLRPGGTLVLVGMPVDPVPVDIVSWQAKEIRVETVFRYANMYPRAIELIASGKVDLRPLITDTLPFSEAIAAFDRAAEARPGDVKLQIRMSE
ncbi:NAD(P)-dependent alcohol dehydrogenase [Roseivivax sp. GX 12232]|uniref:NAD(P)-dependent alcohol dehydrogenase n=1 Tax=Roseivivax sp. GX 12232 TaxID=2900547 RepID=UPI001E56B742|nr:NAD(P)-dependent alcohol dehydrogenase [Roseivivax sp. GX 12232]MCE0504116.1 NAD(P)-dependent alcohol dehydrogenase [Roseivivax sp. GX 12232]